MRMLLISRKQYPLAGTSNRFHHLATVHYGVREFIYFLDIATQQTYIEEITGGHLEKVDDDELWYAIGNFLQEQGVTQMVQEEQ
jgi:hypothetical protein